MRKLLLVFIFAFVGLFSAQSQTVNDVPLSSINVDYMRIVGTSKLLSTKVNVEIDFGQESGFWKRNNKIKDANGKALKFNSMIDALNFMSKNGYEFVTAYVITISNQNVYHYLLKKKKK